MLDTSYSGTVCAVTKANTNIPDYRSVPGAHFSRFGKLLHKVRLYNNDVGDFAALNPLFYGGPGVTRQRHRIVRLLAKKVGDLWSGLVPLDCRT